MDMWAKAGAVFFITITITNVTNAVMTYGTGWEFGNYWMPRSLPEPVPGEEELQLFLFCVLGAALLWLAVELWRLGRMLERNEWMRQEIERMRRAL